MANPTQLRGLVLVSAIAAVATACGPLSIDIAGLPTTKPSGGTATTGPSSQPSPGTTTYPSVKPTQTPNVGRTAEPGRTPGPNDTPGPSETGGPTPTGDPNATPQPGTSATPSPSGSGFATPSPVPTGNATPVAWPSAEDIPGEPVQGKAYEIKRDAGKPTDVAVDKAGVAWIAIGKRATGSEVGAVKGEVVTLAADGKPLKVYTLDGNPQRIEAAKDGGVWVLMDARTASGGGSALSMALLRLGADGKLLSRVDLSAGSSFSTDTAALVPDNAGNAWVKNSSYNGQLLHRVGAGGGLLGTYNSPSTGYASGSPGGLGVDNENRALLAEFSSKQIVRVGTNLQKDITFPAVSETYGANHVQGSADKIWVSFSNELQLWRADGTKFATTKTGYFVNDMTADGVGGMWVLGISGSYQSFTGSVVHYDKDGTAEASYAVGPDPRGFGVGGDGSIWAANYDAGTVTRVGTR